MVMVTVLVQMELECWEATFRSDAEDGSVSESSTSRFMCDSSNPVMMRWQANRNGSTLVGGSTQTEATPVRVLNCVVCVCVCE